MGEVGYAKRNIGGVIYKRRNNNEKQKLEVI